MKEYVKLADYYDFLMNDVDYGCWYQFILEGLDKYPNSRDKVLELGCGTGNITKYLKEDLSIRSITAVDISEDMLIKLQEKIGHSRKIEIIASDIVDMTIYKKYNLVIACCDTINYIKEKDIELVFRKIYNSLEEDGIFHFDINSYYKLKYTLGNNIFINEENHIFYTWENEFFEDTEECLFHLNFFVKKENSNNYIRFTEEHLEKAYKEKYLIELLKKVGFTEINLYYDFKKEKNNEAQRILFFAKKCTNDIKG